MRSEHLQESNGGTNTDRLPHDQNVGKEQQSLLNQNVDKGQQRQQDNWLMQGPKGWILKQQQFVGSKRQKSHSEGIEQDGAQTVHDNDKHECKLGKSVRTQNLDEDILGADKEDQQKQQQHRGQSIDESEKNKTVQDLDQNSLEQHQLNINVRRKIQNGELNDMRVKWDVRYNKAAEETQAAEPI